MRTDILLKNSESYIRRNGGNVMSLQVEKLEKNMAKLTIEVSSNEVEDALQKAYEKQKSKISVPGFRKGKVPRQMVEKMYGVGVFYEDAVNEMIPTAYDNAATESELDIVSQPKIEVVQIEKGKEFIFTAEVAIKPDVELGDYKGIEIPKTDIEVTQEDIMEEIDKEREKNSRIITVDDRAVEDGDMTVIDFEGFVDGNPFEGGKGEDYPLTIGTHSFIDTFEEQLIGKNIDEDVDVNVTFPEEYHSEELKGKPALFKVKVKEIKKKELPELDDDFVEDVSEFSTVAEYKDSINEIIKERKTKEAKATREDAVLEKIIENSKMEIPEAMIDSQVKQMAEDFSRRLSQQGLSVEQYFQYTGLTAETLLEQMKPQAIKRIQSRLVLEAIAKAEDIQVSEEEFENELENMATSYKMEVEKLKPLLGDKDVENMKSDIAVSKAATLVEELAKEV